MIKCSAVCQMSLAGSANSSNFIRTNVELHSICELLRNKRITNLEVDEDSAEDSVDLRNEAHCDCNAETREEAKVFQWMVGHDVRDGREN